MAKSFNFTFAFAACTGAFLLSFMSLEVLSDISTNSNVSRYTFSWPYTDDDKMKPRGGTTVGAPLRLSSAPSSHWTQLQAPSLTKKEKDRKAILAMQGPYRASFDFLESVGYLSDYVPPRPYQSWGTEYVYVVDEEEDFISLQHILVMFMQDEEDKIKGPFVIKHWRQDWKYENRLLVEYKGQDTWLPRQLGKKEAEGTWTQAVFQVDDSPRYESFGRWEHEGGVSTWESMQTWRPLPRREFSVRDDYDALVGTNRHTITPSGWIHEERNFKAKGSNGEVSSIIAQELGFNRYERIDGHDFSAGDKYWENTAVFWSLVRDRWAEIFRGKKSFSISRDADGTSMLFSMMALANSIDSGELSDEKEIKKEIGKRFIKYVETTDF